MGIKDNLIKLMFRMKYMKERGVAKELASIIITMPPPTKWLFT